MDPPSSFLEKGVIGNDSSASNPRIQSNNSQASQMILEPTSGHAPTTFVDTVKRLIAEHHIDLCSPTKELTIVSHDSAKSFDTSSPTATSITNNPFGKRQRVSPTEFLRGQVHRPIIECPDYGPVLKARAFDSAGEDVTSEHFLSFNPATGRFQATSHALQATRIRGGYCLSFRVNLTRPDGIHDPDEVRFYSPRDMKSVLFRTKIKLLAKSIIKGGLSWPDPECGSDELWKWINSSKFSEISKLPWEKCDWNGEIAYCYAANCEQWASECKLVQDFCNHLQARPKSTSFDPERGIERIKLDWHFFGLNDVLIGGYEIELVERNDKEDSFPLVSRTVALDSVVFMRLRPQLQQADKSSISACWCPDQQSPLLLPSHHSADAKCTYILLEAVTKKIGRHSIVLVHEDEGGIESEVVTLEVIPKSKDTMALLIGATYEGNAPLHGTLHDVQRMEILLRHEFGFDSIEKLTAKEVTKDNITRKLLEIQKNGHGVRLEYPGGSFDTCFALHSNITSQMVEQWTVNGDTFIPFFEAILSNKNASAITIFDCCYSTGISRADSDALSKSKGCVKMNTTRAFAKEWKPFNFKLPYLVHIAASSSEREAKEIQQEKSPDGCAGGALTLGIYHGLRELSRQRGYIRCSELSCEAIHQIATYQVFDKLKLLRDDEHGLNGPQIEGNHDLMLGEQRLAVMSTEQRIVVSYVNEKEIRVRAGRVHAMTPGVYELRSLIDGTPKALVDVHDVFDFESVGRIQSLVGTIPLPGDRLHYKHVLPGTSTTHLMSVHVDCKDPFLLTSMTAMIDSYPRFLARVHTTAGLQEYLQVKYPDNNNKWTVHFHRAGVKGVEFLVPCPREHIAAFVTAMADGVQALRVLQVPLPSNAQLAPTPTLTITAGTLTATSNENWNLGDGLDKALEVPLNTTIKCTIKSPSNAPIHVAAFLFQGDGSRKEISLSGNANGTTTLVLHAKASVEGRTDLVQQQSPNFYCSYKRGDHAELVGVVVVLVMDQQHTLDALLSQCVREEYAHLPIITKIPDRDDPSRRGPKPLVPNRWNVVRIPLVSKLRGGMCC